MTREEAIKRLKEIDIRDALQEDYDALHMAIKALEKEPKIYHLSNKEWIDFLVTQFEVSRTTAKDMLHLMLGIKNNRKRGIT